MNVELFTLIVLGACMVAIPLVAIIIINKMR